MRWNSFAGTAIVPTIARLVLALAFVTAGYAKVFKTAEFTAEQAAALKILGVDLAPVATTVALLTPLPQHSDEQEGIDQKPPVDQIPADDDQDEGDDAPQTPPVDSGNGQDDDGDVEPGDMIEVPITESDEMYTGRMVNHLVLFLDENGIANPRPMAWIAALTEFLGGILILIGLFSRVWGLGLTITMAMAFYMTTMNQYFVVVGPFEAASSMEHAALTPMVFTQLGLGVLALLIFLAGPGPLSLDRLIFRPRRREEPFENVEHRRET